MAYCHFDCPYAFIAVEVTKNNEDTYLLTLIVQLMRFGCAHVSFLLLFLLVPFFPVIRWAWAFPLLFLSAATWPIFQLKENWCTKKKITCHTMQKRKIYIKKINALTSTIHQSIYIYQITSDGSRKQEYVLSF